MRFRLWVKHKVVCRVPFGSQLRGELARFARSRPQLLGVARGGVLCSFGFTIARRTRSLRSLASLARFLRCSA